MPVEKAKHEHVNETFSVEQNEVRSTNCRCNLLAADIEGLKLDMVIMQMQIESNNESQNRVLNKLSERDEITCLKQDLLKERERRKELEKDMTILVEGRNREVEELNNTIASLQYTLESIEMSNKCLSEEITQINSNNLLKASCNVSTQCRLDRPELINHRSNRGSHSTHQYSSHDTNHKAIRNKRENKGEIKLNNGIKPSLRDVNPKESSPNNKSTEEATNTIIKPKSRAHEQLRPDWIYKLPLIDGPEQFDSSPRCNTIEIAKEQVSEANQLTFTSNLPATIEIAESICDQHFFRKNPFPKNQLRSRLPSYLKRPTQDWLNHLELVHQVMKPMKHSRNGQFLFELQPDLSKNIAVLPLTGQRWF